MDTDIVPTEITEYGQLLTLPAQKFVKSTLIVVSVGQADHAFAKGWRKLPTELKIEVLSYILVHDQWIHDDTFTSGEEVVLSGLELRHHLALGPDFDLAI
jgi:hypothetical protein